MKPVYPNVLFSLLFTCFLTICLSKKADAQESMRANLLVMPTNGNPTLMDGNYTNYDNAYSNSVDWDDAWKMPNMGENFGIYRENINLVVERRSEIGYSDTTFFRMWNMQARNYRVELTLMNMHQTYLSAFIKDNYLQTTAPVSLNGATGYNFSVTSDPGSADPMRFQLIYVMSNSAVVPVSLRDLKGSRKNNVNMLTWIAEQESNLATYQVETSADGLTFTTLRSVIPNNKATESVYNVEDYVSANTTRYYRIKAVSTDGKEEVTNIVRLAASATANDISVYPTVVSNGILHIEANRKAFEKLAISLVRMNGSRINLQSIQIPSGQFSQVLNIPSNVPAGSYLLQFTGTDGKQVSRQIIIQ